VHGTAVQDEAEYDDSDALAAAAGAEDEHDLGMHDGGGVDRGGGLSSVMAAASAAGPRSSAAKIDNTGRRREQDRQERIRRGGAHPRAARMAALREMGGLALTQQR